MMEICSATLKKVTGLFSNMTINISNDCSKPPAFKFNYHSFKRFLLKPLKRTSSMLTVLGVHLGGGDIRID